MYVIRRATLVTVALILLASSFIFAHGKVTPSSGEHETPTQPSSTTVVDRSDQAENATALPDLEGDTDETSMKPVNEEAWKGKPEAVLYYEITKRVKKCNLTLDDVQSVLSQKDDDQFTYMLADKLGYIVDGRYDDPHIPVIKSRKGNLTALLRKRETLLRPQIKTDQDSSVSTEPPKDKAPVVKSKGQIGFEVAEKIQSLPAEAIHELLDDFALDDSLGYAVGHKLGYPDGDEHMEYLENADVANLRKQLQQVLKSKVPDRNKPTSKPVKPPKQDEGTDGDEPLETETPPSEVSNVHVTNAASRLQNLGNDRMNEHTNNDGEIQGGGESEPENPSRNNRIQLGSILTEVSDHIEVTVPEEPLSLSEQDQGDSNEGTPDVTEHKKQSDDNDNQGSDMMDELTFLEDDEFMKYLMSVDENLYYELDEEPFLNVDEHVIKLAKEKYKEWTAERAEKEKGANRDDAAKKEGSPPNQGNNGGDNANEDRKGGEKISDSRDQPAVNLDGGPSSDSDDEEEYVRSSSFGAWHFLSIFLILGAVVVIGYLCMHNRKKIREGVATYVNDSSKRRRRAREYKPLMTT